MRLTAETWIVFLGTRIKLVLDQAKKTELLLSRIDVLSYLFKQ